MNAAVTQTGLTISNLTIDFERVTAVNDVSFHVDQGEIMALLGPSGCGKSTLLRAIAGLEEVSGGAISWDGDDQAKVLAHQRRFSLMFQDGQLFKNLDVTANIAYGLDVLPRHRRPSKRDRQLRVAQLLELVGLTGMGARAVTTLSGGEQQRVALARALAPTPRMVLLDEPLSSLDRGMRERLLPELQEILRASRTAALFVTHDHDEAFAIADRVALMDQGRILQVGPPVDVWREPASRAVAEFIGCTVFPIENLPSGVLPDDSDLAADAIRRGARWIGVHPNSWDIISREAATDSLGAGVVATVVGGVFHRAGFHLDAQVAGLGRCRINVPEGLFAEGEEIIVRLKPSMTSWIMS